MARTLASLPEGTRITDYISFGVIAKFLPVEKVREGLKRTRRAVRDNAIYPLVW
jgi:hypothetical protein